MKKLLPSLLLSMLPLAVQAGTPFILSIQVTGPNEFSSLRQMAMKDGAPYLTTLSMPPLECEQVLPPAGGSYQLGSVHDGLTVALEVIKEGPEGVDLKIDTQSWVVTELGAELERDRCYTDTGKRERQPIPNTTWHLEWDKPQTVTLLNGTVMSFTPSRKIALFDGSNMTIIPAVPDQNSKP